MIAALNKFGRQLKELETQFKEALVIIRCEMASLICSVASDRSHATIANPVQLKTDGHKVYLQAVEDAFADINYAMLVRLYGEPASADAAARRCKPSE